MRKRANKIIKKQSKKTKKENQNKIRKFNLFIRDLVKIGFPDPNDKEMLFSQFQEELLNLKLPLSVYKKIPTFDIKHENPKLDDISLKFFKFYRKEYKNYDKKISPLLYSMTECLAKRAEVRCIQGDNDDIKTFYLFVLLFLGLVHNSQGKILSPVEDLISNYSSSTFVRKTISILFFNFAFAISKDHLKRKTEITQTVIEYFSEDTKQLEMQADDYDQLKVMVEIDGGPHASDHRQRYFNFYPHPMKYKFRYGGRDLFRFFETFYNSSNSNPELVKASYLGAVFQLFIIHISHPENLCRSWMDYYLTLAKLFRLTRGRFDFGFYLNGGKWVRAIKFEEDEENLKQILKEAQCCSRMIRYINSRFYIKEEKERTKLLGNDKFLELLKNQILEDQSMSTLSQLNLQLFSKKGEKKLKIDQKLKKRYFDELEEFEGTHLFEKILKGEWKFFTASNETYEIFTSLPHDNNNYHYLQFHEFSKSKTLQEYKVRYWWHNIEGKEFSFKTSDIGTEEQNWTIQDFKTEKPRQPELFGDVAVSKKFPLNYYDGINAVHKQEDITYWQTSHLPRRRYECYISNISCQTYNQTLGKTMARSQEYLVVDKSQQKSLTRRNIACQKGEGFVFEVKGADDTSLHLFILKKVTLDIGEHYFEVFDIISNKKLENKTEIPLRCKPASIEMKIGEYLMFQDGEGFSICDLRYEETQKKVEITPIIYVPFDIRLNIIWKFKIQFQMISSSAFLINYLAYRPNYSTMRSTISWISGYFIDLQKQEVKYWNLAQGHREFPRSEFRLKEYKIRFCTEDLEEGCLTFVSNIDFDEDSDQSCISLQKVRFCPVVVE